MTKIQFKKSTNSTILAIKGDYWIPCYSTKKLSKPYPLSTQTVYMLPPLPSTSNLFATHQSEHKIRSWPTCDIQTPPKIFSVTSNHSPLHRSYLFLCPYLLLSILLWPQSLPGHFHKTPILSFLHQVWFFKSVLNCHDDGILHLCPFVSVCPH